MKLCFSTLGCVDKYLGEVIALAERFSLSGVELRGLGGEIANGKIPALAAENASSTKALFTRHGIAPVVLGTSCAFHTDEKRARAIEEGRAAIDIAESLGIPYVRVFGNSLTVDRDACYDRVISGIGELCRYAEGKGVTVLLEVHGDFVTAERLRPITDALGASPAFGLIWDVAHSHKATGADFLPFYRAMRPYIRHVHLKDLRDCDKALVLPGEGDIPLREIVRTMEKDGYTGYFSLEWEKHWHPELPPIEEALASFTALLGRDGAAE